MDFLKSLQTFEMEILFLWPSQKTKTFYVSCQLNMFFDKPGTYMSIRNLYECKEQTT